MHKYMRCVPVLLLCATPALAAEPLAPGKPAGLRQAQPENGTGMLVVAGGAAIGIGIALATADNGPSGPANTTPSNSTSGTTP